MIVSLSESQAGAGPDYSTQHAFPENGWFGPFGGAFVPETLRPSLDRLEEAAYRHLADTAFNSQLEAELQSWAGRPTSLTRAERLSSLWGAEILLKREDLAHTGAHKINNAIGQVLLARAMGLRRIVAETGAGQHGVATAAACARLGLECVVYMGQEDARRQAPNVGRMKLFNADVREVTSGDRTLRSAVNEAIRDWVTDPEDTFYAIGSVVGPHPYPWIVREFQSVIGREAIRQLGSENLPDSVVACVGGGSNAIGTFRAFLERDSVQLFGFEAAGDSGLGAATLSGGSPGVLHGSYSMLLQDQHGQVCKTHSISAGLDYPGVGPEHSHLAAGGKAIYRSVGDSEALAALKECCEAEGILPALETAHALAGAKQVAAEQPGTTILVCLSGRGDKDLEALLEPQ